MKRLICVTLLALAVYPLTAHCAEYFGKYVGSVQTEWDDDGEKMKLISDYSYEDPNGMQWLAKKGQKIDGASIPRYLWSIVGSPYTGPYRNASVLHDIACIEKNRTWEVVHLAFYYAMRASGVNENRAKLMYAAVYHFGPRWPLKERVVLRGAYTNEVPIPATYKSVSEVILAAPASKEWREVAPNTGTVLERKKDPITGRDMVLVEIPASYRTVTRQTIDMPASVRVINIPAEYGEVLTQPPPKNLTDVEFKILVDRLESLEQSSSSLSLEEIQKFSPKK